MSLVITNFYSSIINNCRLDKLRVRVTWSHLNKTKQTPLMLRVLLAAPLDLLVASRVAERKASSSLASDSSSDEVSPQHTAVKKN